MERRRQEQRQHPSAELLSSQGSERQRQRRPPAGGSPREPAGAVLGCASMRRQGEHPGCRLAARGAGWKEPKNKIKKNLKCRTAKPSWTEMSIFYIQVHPTLLDPKICGSSRRCPSPLPKPSTRRRYLDLIYFHCSLANLLLPYSSTV